MKSASLRRRALLIAAACSLAAAEEPSLLAPPPAATPVMFAAQVAAPATCAECAPARPLCCPAPAAARGWFAGEYVGWIGRGDPIGILGAATAGPQAGLAVPPSVPSFENYRPGFRLGAGRWLGNGQDFAVEGNFWMTDNAAADRRLVGPNGQISVVLGGQFVTINDPNAVPPKVGGVRTAQSNQAFGMSLGVRSMWCGQPASSRGYSVFGWETLQLDDHLDAVFAAEIQTGNPATVEADLSRNNIRTSNSFQGFYFGLGREYVRGALFLDASCRLGLGNVQQVVRNDGQTIVTVGGVQQVNVPAGLLVQTGGIGTHVHNQVGVMPELQVKGGVQVRERLRTYLSYSLLALPEVIRPGGAQAYWLQGFGAGVEWRY